MTAPSSCGPFAAGACAPLLQLTGKPPVPLAAQVGAMLGELVAAGGADIKVIAEHIRMADANPDEIEVGGLGCVGGCVGVGAAAPQLLGGCL